MADNKISRIANLIERTRSGAKETPVAQYASVADLINRTIAAGPVVPGGTGAWKTTLNAPAQGGYKMDINEAPDAASGTEWLAELANEQNAVGYGLRVLTGLGRGITNAAYNAMDHSNQFWKNMRQGNYQGAVEQTLAGAADTVWGAARGVADSLFPEFDSWTKNIDSRPIIEGGYDMLKSDVYKEFSKDNPVLEKLASEEKLTTVGVPFTDWKMDITPAGLTATGWDIFTDPASYMTFGIGGALKGAGKGISSVRQFQKAGKPTELANIPEKALPSPYYKGTAGADAYRQPTYNVANTSPAMYVLKEMGRGFSEAHRNAWNITKQRAEARRLAGGFFLHLAEKITGKTGKLSSYEETINSIDTEKLVHDFVAAANKSGTMTPEELQALDGAARVELQTLLDEITANPEGVTKLTGSDIIARLDATAKEKGITLVEETADQLAANYLRSIPKRQRLIKSKKDSNIDIDAVDNLARTLENIADPNTPEGDVAAAFNGFKESVDPETYQAVLKQILRPVGWKEKAAKGKEGGTESTVAQAYGLVGAGGRGRMKDTDYTYTRERQPGTKGTKIKAVKNASAEMNYLRGAGRALYNKFFGAGSKLSRQGVEAKPNIWTEAEAEDAYKKLLAVLKTAGVREDSEITGEMLAAAGISPALLSARIGFIRNQVSVKSPDAVLLERTAKSGYNPLTAQAEAVRIGKLPIDAAGRAASGDVNTTLTSAIKTSNAFKAKVTDPTLKDVLSRIGIRPRDIDALFTAPDGSVILPRIAEELTRSRAAQAIRMRDLEIKRLEARYGNKLIDEATRDTEIAKLKDADAALGKYINNNKLPSDDELKNAQAILEQMFEDRLAAINSLQLLGVDAYSHSGRIVTEGLTAGRSAGRKSSGDILLADVADATKLRIGKQPATKTAAFGDLIEKLGKIKAVQKDNPGLQKALDGIRNIVDNLEERVYTPVELRAISAKIGNFTKRLEENLVYGSSAYNLAFRNRGGEIASARVPGFLVQAYRSSRGKTGDGGVFADYIDGLLESRRLPGMAETPDKKQLALMANLGDVWRGEELTAELLMAITRDASHQGTKGIKTPETAASVRTFLAGLKEDANRMEQQLRVKMVDDIIEMQGGMESLIRANEDEFISVKSGEGDNMLKAIAKTPEEEQIAIEAYNSTRLEVAAVADKLKRLEQLKVPLYTKDGMVVRNGYVDWKKFKPKKDSAQPTSGLKITQEQEIEMLKKSIYFAGYKQANRNAIVAIERGRAGEIVKDMFPSFATAPEIMKVAEKLLKNSPRMAPKADIVMRSRIMLAERLTKIDMALAADNMTRGAIAQVRSGGIKARALKKQREELDKLLTRLDQQLEKSGVVRGETPVAGLTLDQVIDLENPRMFIDWVRQFNVRTSADKDTWALALGHVENLTKVGKGQAYSSVEQLFKSYRENRIGLKAGDINPITGAPVPSTQQILDLLALKSGDNYIFEPFVGKASIRHITDAAETGVMPERSKVLRWLRGFGNEPIEMILRRAKADDFIRASQMPNGDAVRQIEQTLEDPQTVHLQFAEHFNSEVNAAIRDGLPEIVDLASLMAGQSIRRFMIEGADYEHVFTDALGRQVRADTAAVGKRKAMKFNWEKETNLDGWKALLQNLSALAERNGLDLGTPARAEFMTTLALRAIRLRDAYYHVRGIFPSTTVDLKSGEASLLKLFGKEVPDSARAAAKRGVFLSEADVMDVLGPELNADLLFQGPIKSLPVTSFLGPARVLVMAMDNLKPGQYFTSEEISTLGGVMQTMAINHVRQGTSVSANVKKTGFDFDPNLTHDQINKLVSTLLHEDTARKLFESHTINAAYATKLLKYKSMQVSQPIIDAWLRIAQSPNAAVGMKIEETLKAIEDLQKAIGQEVDPNMQMMLEMDSRVAMFSHIDPDSVIKVREAEDMTDTWETQGIKSVQGKNQARAKSAQARMSLHQAVLSDKVAAASKEGVPEEYMFDVFNDGIAGQQEINHFLKWGYGAMERLFAATGMEDLRAIYSPTERSLQNSIDGFNKIAQGMAETWAKKAPGRNIMAEAWAILRDMPEEALAKASLARQQRLFLAEKVNQGVKADWDMIKQLDEEAKMFDELLPGDDELLKDALTDLFKLHNSILGGGRYSVIMRSGINPRVINRTLHEIGAGRQSVAITPNGDYIVKRDGYGFPPGAKDVGAVANAWRDWDLTNPLDALSHVNHALQQAAKVPEMAVSVDSMFGVAKSKYANAKEAAADGLVQIKPVESPSMGREIVYYMQTDSLYYPVQIAEQLGTFSKFVTEIKRMEAKGAAEKLMRATSQIQNIAKQQMTLFTLKNWVQNTVGGYWTNWMAGVNNPLMTTARSVKLLQARGISTDALGIDARGLEAELAKFEASQRKQGFVIRAENDPRADGVVVKVRGKQSKFNYADLSKLFTDMGGVPPHTQSRDLDLLRPGSEDISAFNATSSFIKKVGAKYDKASGFLGKWASERDAMLRGQLWLDILMKGNWTSLEQGAREAMRIVDRYHPQLQDLSTFNQKYTRQFVMFFTWRAKTLGWILTDMLNKPGRALAPIKAQYNLTQNEDLQYGEFGTLDPYGMPLPGYAQNNLDPLLTGADGGIYRMSLANPVTDLLGSTGWLSGIEWSNYQPAAGNVATSMIETFNRFVFTSEPIVLATIMDWKNGQSFNGTKFGNGAGDFSTITDVPVLVEEFANRMGLGSNLTMAAAVFPDFFLKASMQGQSNEFISSEEKRAWINWLTGLKLGQVDTLKNRQAGMKEILAKIQEAFKTGFNK